VTPPRCRTRAWQGGDLVARDFAIAEVSDWLQHDGTVVWVDLCGPDAEVLHQLAGELSLHELAVEDALSPHQRAKLDHYKTHRFLATHAVASDGPGTLRTIEIDAFIGPNWLITVRKDDEFDIGTVVARWERSQDLIVHGVSYLVYTLVDTVVDGYFDVVSTFDEYYDEISERLFGDEPLEPSDQREWFDVRRNLVRFHRLVAPMREVVSGLMRREHGMVENGMYPYFQDVYDHMIRVVEDADSIRDLVATIVDTNLSLREYRQNQVMKKVTSWAAIIAVPTLVTGYYGMNVPFPGFAQRWGWVVSVAVMGVMVAVLSWVFRRHEWL
jgi:magnesium transporter